MKPRKKGQQYEIAYRCKGYKKPFYECFPTYEEANLRTAQIEYEKSLGVFQPPKPIPQKERHQPKRFVTMAELLDEFVQVYGLNHWGDSYLSMSRHRIEHYIKPYLGNVAVKDLTTHDLDLFYDALQDKPAVVLKGHKDTGSTVSLSVIEKIHSLIRSALKQAVKWEYISSNPADNISLPKYKPKPREVWSTAQAQEAIQFCPDPILKITMLLALGCSMRIGEILGLTWDCTDFSDESIADGTAHVVVEKELKRCNKVDMEALEKRGRSKVILKFPPIKQGPCTTVLVLKAPKTDSSIRTVYLPKTVALALREVQGTQKTMKETLGTEYMDFNLVIAHENGRPYEERQIAKLLKDMIAHGDLPEVVFHSLRHCSASLKLRIGKGNIKAVQGDTGHAQARMVTDLYAHICNEDRRILAQNMETDFFQAHDTHAPSAECGELEQAVEVLKNNPQLANLIVAMQRTNTS